MVLLLLPDDVIQEPKEKLNWVIGPAPVSWRGERLGSGYLL
jgi:hypothetical protein